MVIEPVCKEKSSLRFERWIRTFIDPHRAVIRSGKRKRRRRRLNDFMTRNYIDTYVDIGWEKTMGIISESCIALPGGPGQRRA
jgi:hypothetical protein